MFDRFDEDTRRAFGVARRESERLLRREIDTEHLLLGIAAGTGALAIPCAWEREEMRASARAACTERVSAMP